MSCENCNKKPSNAIATFVTNEERKARLTTCRTCENWLFGICKACGCPMFLKTRLETLAGQKVDCEHKQGSKWDSM